MRPPRLVVADGDGLVLRGLQALLQGDFEIVGTARDGLSLLKAVEDTHPDGVVLSVSLPEINGIAAAQNIRRLAPDAALMFLASAGELGDLAAALSTGASGYVLKSSAEEELPRALQSVLAGHSYATSTVRASDPDRNSGRRGAYGLSPRERQVLQLVAHGKSAKEIANALEVSVKTVEYHKYRMMKRLGIHTAAELAIFAATRTMLEGTARSAKSS